MKKQLLFAMIFGLSIGFASAQFVIDDFTGNTSSGIGEAAPQPDWGSGVSVITYENDQLKSDYSWTNADWYPRAVWYHFDEYQDFSAMPTMKIKFMVTDNFNDSIKVRFDLYGDATINGVVEDTVEANARPWEMMAENGTWYEVVDDFTANDRWACTYWNGGIEETVVDNTKIKGFEAFAAYGDAAYNNQAGTLIIDYIKMGYPVGVNELLVGKESAYSMAVYPNPVSDALTVNAENKISTLRVFDVTGKMVETFENVNAKITQLNVSEYSNGLYFIAAQDNKGQVVSKKFQVK